MARQVAEFVRIISDIEDLERLYGIQEPYVVIKEVDMSNDEFNEFVGNLNLERSWLSSCQGGKDEAGRVRCVRVFNRSTGVSLLVNGEGGSCPVFVALEC